MKSLLFILCFSLLGVCSCSRHSQTSRPLEPPTIQEQEPKTFDGLRNVVAFQDDIFSGSKPDGLRGMETLGRWGVQTIICVDGVAPDVIHARKKNIKTIHIPMKYDAPTDKQILDLATAVSMGKVDGNVYIHCHHGKHRSATAAAIVSIALGLASVEEMRARMVVSQTSPHYTGMWDAVDKQHAINRDDVIRNEQAFPSRVTPEGMTAQMVAIDDSLDNLKCIKASHWTTPRNHPDLVAGAEAGFIAETFRQLQEDDSIQAYPNDFATKLSNALLAAKTLEKTLTDGITDPEVLSSTMRALTTSCTACHRAYRK